MSKTLYAITAIKSGLPVGAFIIADNPDDCVARASRRLGTRDRITHMLPMCEATLGTMKRNGLLRYVNEDGKVEFLADAILEIIESLRDSIDTIQLALRIQRNLAEKLKLQKFRFSVSDKKGVPQFLETFAPDYGAAIQSISKHCLETYGRNFDFVIRVTDDEPEPID